MFPKELKSAKKWKKSLLKTSQKKNFEAVIAIASTNTAVSNRTYIQYDQEMAGRCQKDNIHSPLLSGVNKRGLSPIDMEMAMSETED